MLIARPMRPSELAWPPTCAYFVHHLHKALKTLVSQAERLGSKRPGYPEEIGEQRLWEAVYGVEQFFHIRGIEQDYERFDDVLSEALPWLKNVLSKLPTFDRGNPPPEAKQHVQWVVSQDCLDSLRDILALVRDPFDSPKGESLMLFEWARHTLGIDEDCWNFVNGEQIPDWFRTEWGKALVDDLAGELRPTEIVNGLRRGLLLKIGLLRVPTQPEPTSKSGSDGESGAEVRPRLGVEQGYEASEPETREDKERRVKAFLDQRPNARSSQIGKALGINEKTVRGLDAWKSRPGAARNKPASTVRRFRPLTPEILAARPGSDPDPSDEAELREIIASQYLDQASGEQKNEYFRAGPNEQRDILWRYQHERPSDSEP
jgi:hypothetical protein